ncbi:hypothetical protein YX06_19875 [Salmonella enterica subsp. enterica serovar Kentucky]|nr:hypothetical protein [Salmonella enterica subsp. enterica serovar Kentucky]
MAKKRYGIMPPRIKGRARVKGDAGRYHILGVLWHERALILSRPHGYIEVEILPLTPEEEETYGLFDN